MALNPSNSSNFEQLALKAFITVKIQHTALCVSVLLHSNSNCYAIDMVLTLFINYSNTVLLCSLSSQNTIATSVVHFKLDYCYSLGYCLQNSQTNPVDSEFCCL